MNIVWMKCTGNVWCSLKRLDLTSVRAKSGVYILFTLGSPGQVVYVGSSEKDIAERLRTHKADARFEAYSDVRVTWADVSPQYVRAVEKFLADKWNPLVGDAHPDVLPLQVNSPF